jgi:RNA polymerase sigma-70 factor, ECF subfamily
MSDKQSQSGCRLSGATCDEAMRPTQDQPLSAWKDEQLLIEYARSGQQPAFEEIVRRYQRKVHSFLCRYLGDRQLAEDALQATFLQVHLKCRLFEPGRALSPWIYCIATHQATDLLRRNRRHKAVSLEVTLRGSEGSEERAMLLDI